MPSKQVHYPALEGQYVVHKTLGTGGFAKVKLATHILTGEMVAIKVMNKESLGDDLPRVQLEIEALKELSHQNICKLYQIVETEEQIFLVLEYCPGGELFDYIVEKERLTEGEAKSFFRQILCAVAYIHEKGYAHRDLKPENLLLHSDHRLKLIDFGLCAKPKAGMQQNLETCCGSPAYAAPELISGDVYHGSSIDVWSMGVLLYALLCGFLPFDDENISKLYRKIQRGRFACPSWLSSGSKVVLSEMLEVNPAKRIPIKELLFHPWVTEGLDSPLRWRSIHEREKYDPECLAELAVCYGRPMKSLQMTLQQRKFDYLTATYLLLESKKSQGKPVELLSTRSIVLREKKQSNRSLALAFNSKPINVESYEDDLDGIDLLGTLSPKQDSDSILSSRTSPYTHRKPTIIVNEFNKENFIVPHIPSPRKEKKIKNKPSENLRSHSAQKEKTRSPFQPSNSVPLACEKRATSFESPLKGSESIMTPTKRPPWESASLSAKKVFGSIEKRLDRVKNMLTPNKQMYSCGVNVPRKVKTLCNVSSTNDEVSPDELLDSLQNALLQKGIQCKQIGYTLRGKVRDVATGKAVLKFELEVCRLPHHQVFGVRRKRLVGDAWHYKRICEEVLKLAALHKS